ncbi:MAG: hypothetical protein LBV15_04180 [Planctomycetota bacterium]|nr:hypothetical protein [Planctomycetota bacterium]
MAGNQEASGEAAAAIMAVRAIDVLKRFRYVFAAALLAVAALASILAYRSHVAEKRETAAEESLYRRELEFMSREMGFAPALAAGQPDDLERAVKEFEGLPAGIRALALKFGRSFNSRDFPTAERAAGDFLRVYPGNLLAARMRLALAQSLFMQDKLTEAEAVLRELARTPDSGVLPAAKLSLAQLLERRAEEARDNPEEYRRRLEAAEEEYNDIVSRSRIGAQAGYWHHAIVLPADFALAVIKDKLAGYRHPEPGGARLTEGPEPLPDASGLRPPPEAGGAATGAGDGIGATDGASGSAQVGEAADKDAAEAGAGVTEAGEAGAAK